MPERPTLWRRIRGLFGAGPFGGRAGASSGPPGEAMLVFTETHLVLAWPERGEEALAWEEIERIALRTSDRGGAMAPLHIYVIGARQRLVVPATMAGAADLLAFIERLDTGDRTALAAARADTGAGWHIVWQRDPRAS